MRSAACSARELAASGVEVSLIARGAQLAALRERGLELRYAGQSVHVRFRATDDPTELGPQDYVIVTLKAHQVPGAVPARCGPCSEPTQLSSRRSTESRGGISTGSMARGATGAWTTVDPADVQWNGIGPERVIGCVVYPAAEVIEPGVVELIDGDRFVLGEPSGERTPRVERLSEALVAAGLKAPIRPRIRDELWVKLWGNLSFNPISVLTMATLDAIIADPGTRAVARAMMVEAQAIAERLGVRFAIDVDRRLAGAAAVGAHRTSMLQDLERGRPLELDALLGAVQEIARLVNIGTPLLDAILALATQRARVAGCYK